MHTTQEKERLKTSQELVACFGGRNIFWTTFEYFLVFLLNHFVIVTFLSTIKG